MTVTETSKESFKTFNEKTAPLLRDRVLTILESGPMTHEEIAASLDHPQSTISGVMRPMVKDDQIIIHHGYSTSKFGKRVRTWALARHHNMFGGAAA